MVWSRQIWYFSVKSLTDSLMSRLSDCWEMWKLTVWAGDPRDNLLAEAQVYVFVGGALLWLQDVQWHVLHWRRIIYVASLSMCSWRDNTFLTLTSPLNMKRMVRTIAMNIFEGSDWESIIHGMYTCCCWFFSSYYFIISSEKIVILKTLHAVFQPFSVPLFPWFPSSPLLFFLI